MSIDNGAPLRALEEEVIQLLSQRGKNGEIPLNDLNNHYRAVFKKLIIPKNFGFGNLRGLVTRLDRVEIKKVKTNGQDQFLVCLKTPQESGTTRSSREGNSASSSSYQLIDTLTKLEAVIASEPVFASGSSNGRMIFVSIDCEGVPGNIFLIQLASRDATYIFDCVTLGPQLVCSKLVNLFSSRTVVKIFHDLHNDVLALTAIGGLEPSSFQSLLDTQLLVEAQTGNAFTGFNAMLQHYGQQPHPRKHDVKLQMEKSGGEIFARRPLPPGILQYAADDVNLLIKAVDQIVQTLKEDWDKFIMASELRVANAIENNGARSLCFDVSNDFQFASSELITYLRPEDGLQASELIVHHDLADLYALLPKTMAQILVPYTTVLSDIALDLGEEPIAWVGGERLRLAKEGQTVTTQELDKIVKKLGSFGSDNRAGLERQLHRISAIRNREDRIIGVTMRAGRHVTGNTYMITDLLLSHKEASILFLGEPGSGKTTIVREVCRILSQQQNVFVVDTSNEIAGDGDIKHSCVGESRRMMVPSLDKQSQVMIECVQNHTPEVMVIDEIGRPKEVDAASTCKQRGVRLIASAHGDLRKLVKNSKLRGLVGGVQTVTLGDDQAKEEAKKRGNGNNIQKTKAERAGPPIFEIIVEVKRGAHNDWKVILNSGEAVDNILAGKKYKVQKRNRNPDTGNICLDLCKE